jgi:hypothetical protein
LQVSDGFLTVDPPLRADAGAAAAAALHRPPSLHPYKDHFVDANKMATPPTPTPKKYNPKKLKKVMKSY